MPGHNKIRMVKKRKLKRGKIHDGVMGDAENEKMRDVILESSKTLYSCTGRCRLFPFEKLEKLNM